MPRNTLARDLGQLLAREHDKLRAKRRYRRLSKAEHKTVHYLKEESRDSVALAEHITKEVI